VFATTDQPGVFRLLDSRSVSLDQACAQLRVSRRTVYYLIKGGRLQTIRTQMGSQRVLVDSMKSYTGGEPAASAR
jgi:excisionase family DNA binding protein